MSDTISLGFKLTGEADMKRALADIDNALKVNASELSLVSAKYSENGKSADALTAKNKALQSSIENEQTKINTLKSAIENSSSAHTAAGANIEKLKSQLATATAKMTEMKSATDTTKSDLLAQQVVVKTLTKDLNTAEKAYTSTGKSTTAWSTQLNNSEAKVITMNKQLDENTKALNKSETNSKSLADAVNGLASAAGVNVPPALQGMVNKLDGASASGAALVGVLAGVATALAKTTINTAKSADEIDVLAKKSGMSTDQVQELNYASELLDVSTETVSGSLTKLTRSMDNSKSKTSDQAKAFRELGVSTVDSHGNLRDANEVFLKTVDALGRVKNETERDALSMTVFGKSAKELNPLIEAGSGKLKELSAEAHKVGAVMDNETINQFTDLDDAMKRVDQQSNALKLSFAGVLLPILTNLFQAISKIPTPILQTIVVITGIIASIVLVVKAIKEVTNTGSAISGFFKTTSGEADKTKLIILGVVAALVALAAIIAVIMGKSGELNSTMASIGTSVGKINGQVSTPQKSVSNSLPSYARTSYPGNARGTNYWRGGRTLVGEEGPEVVDLPIGSRVYPNGIIPSSGDTYFTGNIIIDAKNVKEFNDIVKLAKQKGQMMVQMGNY